MHEAPGRSERTGITLVELFERFPDEETATRWLESKVWPKGRCCGHCGSADTKTVPNAKPMPYWCRDCWEYFSVRTGTVMARSKIPLRKWVIAFYLEVTSLKGVSSMKLHRDLGISQKSAWFMLHRIRESWIEGNPDGQFAGPVEVDEAYMGGKRKNMSNARRRKLADEGVGSGGTQGKTAVVGLKDRKSNEVRAKVVESTNALTLQGFVVEHTEPGATVYSDEAAAYRHLPYHHEAVKHSASEYVRGMAHTNGVESFWSMLKRAHTGTYHKMSPKHLDRYVQQFAGKHNFRSDDTMTQMSSVASGLVGKSLTYEELTKDNGLPSGARGGGLV